MNCDLISIIVPVYKVEPYLDRCIRSIAEQTYQNLEIILVDDGSPDNCGAMCDTWSEKDSRIKVIHKENGGLSDARNAGMDAATGEYIAFVDSDDWVEKEYIQAMLQAAISTGSDIAACNVRIVQEGEVVPPIVAKNAPLRIYDSETAIRELMESRGFRQVAWNKLYRRTVLTGERFSVGRLHEDEFFTYRILAKASALVYVDVPLYNYLQRDGSIMRTVNPKRCMDVMDAYYERLRFLQYRYPTLYHRDKVLYCIMCTAYYRASGFARKDKVAIRKLLRKNRKGIRFTPKEFFSYGLKDQVYIIGSKICIGLTSWLLELRIRWAARKRRK